VKNLKLHTNSQLVVTWVKGEAETKEPLLIEISVVMKDKIKLLESFEAAHVHMNQHTRADILVQLARTHTDGITHSFIQETLERPNIVEKVMVRVSLMDPGEKTWIDLVTTYKPWEELPTDPTEASLIKRRAKNHIMIEGWLYKRGLSIYTTLEMLGRYRSYFRPHKRLQVDNITAPRRPGTR
jgi:predicted type IV restriction endonuclease